MMQNDKKQKDSIQLSFSLLWPEGRHVDIVKLNKEVYRDLGIDTLINFFATEAAERDFATNVLGNICRDKKTVLARLDVIDDLFSIPDLYRCLEEILPDIKNLQYFVFQLSRDDLSPLQEVIWRLRELEYFTRCIAKLYVVFSDNSIKLKSAGWQAFSQMIRDTRDAPVFRTLEEELPDLLSRINHLNSITLGVNLNDGLLPCEATILSINSERFSGSSFSRKLSNSNEWQGITPLQFPPDREGYTNPLMQPLFRDISSIMGKTIKPLARSLKQFVSINSRLLLKLKDEFRFLFGVVKAVNRIKAFGMPMVRPLIKDVGERKLSCKDLYNINLIITKISTSEGKEGSLQDTIVGNDFALDETGRIVILTGPNRGGKTTITQAVGLTQLLAQAGLHVPAISCELSMVDQVLTHYPVRERLESGTGRFGEEVHRLKKIFEEASEHSLILLNESLTGTSAGEGLYLAQDLMRVFRILGSRVIFTTHLHQLAELVDEINKDTPGKSKLISLVATIEEESKSIIPTFKVVPGQPQGKSYALELASRYGISKQQLLTLLTEMNKIASSSIG